MKPHPMSCLVDFSCSPNAPFVKHQMDFTLGQNQQLFRMKQNCPSNNQIRQVAVSGSSGSDQSSELSSSSSSYSSSSSSGVKVMSRYTIRPVQSPENGSMLFNVDEIDKSTKSIINEMKKNGIKNKNSLNTIDIKKNIINTNSTPNKFIKIEMDEYESEKEEGMKMMFFSIQQNKFSLVISINLKN
jgi:hypothetical protein